MRYFQHDLYYLFLPSYLIFRLVNVILSVVQSYNSMGKLRPFTHLSTNDSISKLQFLLTMVRRIALNERMCFHLLLMIIFSTFFLQLKQIIFNRLLSVECKKREKYGTGLLHWLPLIERCEYYHIVVRLYDGLTEYVDGLD